MWAVAAPLTITITPPSVPPAETPMMPGSAMGFRNNPCSAVPAVPNAIPTKPAVIIRGRRIWSTTNSDLRQ